MADVEQVKDAADVYVYGYPLVYDLKEVASFVEGGGSLPMQAPYNRFASARRLLGPETRFVSPNNDTLYVGGQCDVRQGPLVLHVPDTHDRYYVLQFIDAWTNNFAYIGRRATGTAEAEYLLTDRDYDGPVPDGMRVVAAPTGVFTIVGRVQLNGRGRRRPPARSARPRGAALVGTVPVALAAFPPPAADKQFVTLAERFGATAGAFRPIMRMYQPQQPILDGTYVLPPVRRVG